MDETPPPPPPPVARAGGWHEHRVAVWAGFLGALALAAAFPVAEAARSWPVPARTLRRFMTCSDAWSYAWPMLAVAAVLGTWVFVFWGMIGSFLNVVVHRLPAGRSVVNGGSRCPRCLEPIRWHDNIPIVGWLRLGGHCRACGLPISSRYPLVEAACAGLCSAICFREVLSDGGNIPLREPTIPHGFGWFIGHADPFLIGLAVVHCSMICGLLVWGLITCDGQRVPPRSILVLLAGAILAAILVTGMHPLPPGFGLPGGSGSADNPLAWLERGFFVALIGGVAGLGTGLLLEAGMARLPRGDASGRAGMPMTLPLRLHAGLALVGIVCGWQGMLGTLVLLLALCLVHVVLWSSVSRWPTLPVELLLVPAAFVHICAWRQLVEGLGPWWAGPAPTPACLAVPATLAVLLAGALVTVTPAMMRHPRASDDRPEPCSLSAGTPPSPISTATNSVASPRSHPFPPPPA